MLKYFKADLDRVRYQILALVVSVINFLIAAYLIIEDAKNDNDELIQFLAVCTLGISVAIAARISSKETKRYLGFTAIGFGVLGLFYFTHVNSPYFPVRFALLALITHLLVAIAPAVRNRFKDEIETGRFNWFLSIRVIMVGVQCAILAGGLSTALWSLKALFNLPVDDRLYALLNAFIGYVVSCFLLIGALDEKRDDKEPVLLRMLIKNVFTPLSIVYFVILYIYAIKIGVQREWPRGVVGWLVSGLSFMAVFTFLIKRPFEKTLKVPAWTEKFWKHSFQLLLPLLLLLAGAIWRRVSEYGWTEERYYLAILTLWTFGLSIYYIRPSRRTIHAIPVSLLFVAIAIFAGPTSAQRVSLVSQSNKIQKLWKLEDRPPQGFVAPKYEDYQSWSQITDILTYICRSHGRKGLNGVLNLEPGWDAKIEKGNSTWAECNYSDPKSYLGSVFDKLKLERGDPAVQGPTPTITFGKVPTGLAYTIHQGTYIVSVDRSAIEEMWADKRTEGFQFRWIDTERTSIQWSLNGSDYTTVDLKPVLDKLKDRKLEEKLALNSPIEHVSSGPAGTMKLKIYFLYSNRGDQMSGISSMAFYAYYTPKK